MTEALLDSPVLVALVTGLLAIAGTVGTARLARGAQKDADTRARVARLEKEGRLLIDYVHQLRTHIADGKGAPPPEWPEGLTR
jgi:hypothetical protein